MEKLANAIQRALGKYNIPNELEAEFNEIFENCAGSEVSDRGETTFVDGDNQKGA